jgi:hypothetical protein
LSDLPRAEGGGPLGQPPGTGQLVKQSDDLVLTDRREFPPLGRAEGADLLRRPPRAGQPGELGGVHGGIGVGLLRRPGPALGRGECGGVGGEAVGDKLRELFARLPAPGGERGQ